MKKIFVTVAEFLENNPDCDLTNREIYQEQRNGVIAPQGQIKGYSDGCWYYEDEYHEQYQEIDNCDEYYVEIDCTPVYHQPLTHKRE